MADHNRYIPRRIAMSVIASLLFSSGGIALAQGEGANPGPTGTSQPGSTMGNPAGDSGANPVGGSRQSEGGVRSGESSRSGDSGGPPDGGTAPPVKKQPPKK